LTNRDLAVLQNNLIQPHQFYSLIASSYFRPLNYLLTLAKKVLF
jgi:hypothetical protein